MADYALLGPKWGSPAYQTSGGTVTWAIDGSVPAYFVDVIQSAFADWSSHANISFQEISSTSDADIDFSDSYIDGLDNVLGEASYSYSGHSFISAAITFDSGEGWHLSGNHVVSQHGVDLFEVALHEIGHAIGLDHYNDQPAIMNSSLAVSITDLTVHDINGVQALYGPPAMAQAFTAPTFRLAQFGTNAGGWSSDDTYHRELGDVNGDGWADIVGFGENGTYVSLATGSGNFGPATFALSAYGHASAAGGWASDNLYHRELADVNGDGRADIVGFGENGTFVSLATGAGSFAPLTLASREFGRAPSAGGWSSDDAYHRDMADVNDDGMADIIGFGEAGVYVALATGNGTFAPSTFELASFGRGAAAGGWSSDNLYHREIADVNGDGRADIVGFGEDGTYLSLAADGGHFSAPTFVLATFGRSSAGGGWSSDDVYHRELADVNGDGMADIVGFGESGTYVSFATGDGAFGPATAESAAFGHNATAGGWSSEDRYPRHLADVNGDHQADIVGFGSAGVYDALSSYHIA